MYDYDNRKRFMFIYPDVGGGSAINYSPAIEILSSYLKANGIDVSLIHLSISKISEMDLVHPNDYDEIKRRVKEYDPDVIGITSTTFQYPIACEVATRIKRAGFKKLIILGGVHATISPSDLEESPFDAFCIGEGEITLVKLMQNLDNREAISNIKGLDIKIDGKIKRNGYPDVLQDLDVLPKRDYEIMNTKELVKLCNGWFSVSFSRGCPYACTFCINQKLRKDYAKSVKGKYYRCQSAKKAINDLLSYIDDYPEIKIFNLDDDLLIMDKEWFAEFSKEYKNKIYDVYGIRYVINTRANFIDENVVRQLRDSGCYECQVGFETGDESLRNKILAKQITDEQLLKAFSLFNEYGVRSLAYTMVGIPEETVESVEKTISMLSELKPTLIRMTFFEPYIGTPLYEYCIENELFEDTYGNADNFTKSTVKLKGISNRDLAAYHLLFPWFLNLKLEIDNCTKNAYKDLISKFWDIEYNELISLETKQRVLEEDERISKQLDMNKISHFCYFLANTNYYSYAKY